MKQAFDSTVRPSSGRVQQRFLSDFAMTRPTLPRVLLFAISYALLAYMSMHMRDPRSLSALVWPAGGILLGAMMRNDVKSWPIWLAIAGALHFIASMAAGRQLFVSVVFVCITLIVSSLIAWLWRSRVGPKGELTTPRGLGWFLGLSAVLVPLGAIVGAEVLHAAGVTEGRPYWQPGAIADGVGILSVHRWSSPGPSSASGVRAARIFAISASASSGSQHFSSRAGSFSTKRWPIRCSARSMSV